MADVQALRWAAKARPALCGQAAAVVVRAAVVASA
jgi:hypothetical protein